MSSSMLFMWSVNPVPEPSRVLYDLRKVSTSMVDVYQTLTNCGGPRTVAQKNPSWLAITPPGALSD